MSREFEWRFGDELPEAKPTKGQPQSQPWRRFLTFCLVLLVVAAGAYAWWRQRQGTLDQAEVQVRQVAGLELGALTAGDVELYMSLQDAADEEWRGAQAAYMGAAALPLPIQGFTKTQTSIEGARVVGDKARVQIKHTAPLSSGVSATFRAVRFYRVTDRGRWVHTKADLAYGGHPLRLVGDRVEVWVLERDADWVEPMASGLGALASSYCDLAGCQEDLRLILDLGATLDEAATSEDSTLPAAFLVGAPANEAAQAAWEASLRGFLLDRLITRQIGSRSPHVHKGEVFQDRLRAWFMRELGLARPVSPDLALVGQALETGAYIPLWELWSLSPDEPRRPLADSEIDLLLAFIEREYGPSAVARLPRALHDAYHPGEAIADVVRDPWWILRRRYLAYVRAVTGERSTGLASFSSYDLLVTCEETFQSTSLIGIWGLRLSEPGLTRLSAGSEFEGMMPISWSPDAAAVLTARREGDGLEYYLLRVGHARPQPLRMTPEDAEPVGSTLLRETGWSPVGAHLAYRVPDRPIKGGIVDLTSGDHATFAGDFVAWSPEGSRLIYAQPIPWHWSPEARVQAFWIWDRDGDHAQRLGQGYAATWSADGTRVAYVTPEPALRTYDTVTEQTSELLDKSSLRQTLDFTPTLSPVSGSPFEIDWSPSGQWIALGATRLREDGSEGGLTMLVGDGVHRLLGTQVGGMLDLSWSPDGRWLTTSTFGRDWSRSVVRDLEGGVLFEGEGALVSWSAEGRHMAVVQGLRPLHILNIESGQWRAVEVPGDCWSVVWNPRAPLEVSIEQGNRPGVWLDGWPAARALSLSHGQP